MVIPLDSRANLYQIREFRSKFENLVIAELPNDSSDITLYLV